MENTPLTPLRADMFGVTSAYAWRTGALPAAGRNFGRKVENHLNKNLAGLFVVFLLLAGVCSMESDDDSEKSGASNRKSYIGRNGLSPAVPPKAVESPGGTVSTPLGSELVVRERLVRRAGSQCRESVQLYAKPEDASPELKKQYARLERCDSNQRFARYSPPSAPHFVNHKS